MTEYTGAGDQRRSMELLWGAVKPGGRGPKQGLTVDEIVAAAIALADADGLGSLSMRKVAERLGKSAMSLYTYVPSKAELVELMLDSVIGEMPTEHSLDDGWRAAVEAAAREEWELYRHHPWTLQVSAARALLAPHELDHYEEQMRLFDGLGLTGVEMSRCAAVVSGFVRGSAKQLSDVLTAEQATGLGEDEWWYARSALLEELATDDWADRYPTLTKLDAEHAFDQLDRPDDTTPYLVQDALDTFEFGLQRTLDGIEAYVEARVGAKPKRGTKRRPPKTS